MNVRAWHLLSHVSVLVLRFPTATRLPSPSPSGNPNYFPRSTESACKGARESVRNSTSDTECREERFLLSRSSLPRAGLRGLAWTTRCRWGIRPCSDYSRMLAVCSLSRYGSSCITNKKTLRVKIVAGYPVTSWYGGILVLNLTHLTG